MVGSHICHFHVIVGNYFDEGLEFTFLLQKWFCVILGLVVGLLWSVKSVPVVSYLLA